MTTKELLANYTLAGTTAKGMTVYKHADGSVLTMKKDSHGTQYGFQTPNLRYAVGSYDGQAVLKAMTEYHEAKGCNDCGKCGDCADHARRMAEFDQN